MAITTQISVRWGDLDALGHVNNTVFFRWFEEVRIQTFAAVGVRVEPDGVGPILATTSCDFLAPVHYPSEVTVTCTIGRIGNTSFEMLYEASVGDTPVATGRGVVVMMDYASGNKVSVDDEQRRHLTEHISQPS